MWSSETKPVRGVDRAPRIRALVGQAKACELFEKQRDALGGFRNFKLDDTQHRTMSMEKSN